MVYDLLDIITLMPGMTFSDDIRKSDTIAGNFETKYHKRKIIDYIY